MCQKPSFVGIAANDSSEPILTDTALRAIVGFGERSVDHISAA